MAGRHSALRRTYSRTPYVEDAGDLLVFVDEAAAKLWWRTLRGGAPVRVLLRGHWQVGHAEVAWEADPPGPWPWRWPGSPPPGRDSWTWACPRQSATRPRNCFRWPTGARW